MKMPTNQSERGPACPKCGGANIGFGYGLAGGGMGAYEYCEDCDWFEKHLDPEVSTPAELAREKIIKDNRP